MNADGSNPRQLTHAGDNNSFIVPQWSPDGKSIAYIWVNHNPTAATIWIMNADGSKARALPISSNVVLGSNETAYFNFGWSPSSNYLAVSIWRTWSGQIDLIDLDGTVVCTLSSGLHADYSPAWLRGT